MFDKNKNEIKKVDKNIEKIEAMIHENFYEIGRLFYETNYGKAEEDSAYKKWMDAAGQLEAQKKELDKEKLKLQGLMKCDYCNSIINYGSVFCNRCGQKLDTDADLEKKKICLFCGAQMEEMQISVLHAENRLMGG